MNRAMLNVLCHALFFIVIPISSFANDDTTRVPTIPSYPTVWKEAIHVIDSTPVVEPDSLDLQRFPVLSVRDAIGLQVEALEYWPNADRGWTLGLTDESIGGPDIVVLGGAPYQSGYFVNGQLFEDPGLGVLTTTISSAAIGRGEFYPMNWSARRGFASSSRTDAYSVLPSTSRIHGGIETLTDNTIGSDYDQNYCRGWLDGGIPGLDRGFFTAAFERRWLGDRRPAPNASEVTSDGSSRLPNNSLDGWSGHGRFSYNFNSRVRFTAVGDYTIDEWQEYRHSWLLNSAHAPRYEDKAYALSGRIDVELNTRNHSGYWVEFGLGGNERYRGDGVVYKDYAAHNRPYVNPIAEPYDLFYAFDEDLNIIADSFLVQNGEIVGGYSRGMFFGVDEATIFNVDTLSSPGDTTISATFLHVPSYYGDYLHRKTDYLGVSAGLVHFVNRYNTVSVGFEGRRYTVRSFRNIDATKGYSPFRVNAYGFDVNGNEYDGDDFRHRAKHPVIAAGYVEDRISLGNLRVSAGVRVEFFDFDSPTLHNPRSPMDPNESLQNDDTNDDNVNDSVIDEGDLRDAEEYIRFSPRLVFKYLLSEANEVHGSIGIHHEAPPFDVIYLDWEFMQARIDAGSYFPFPSPSLEPERTDKWQVGTSHTFGPSLVIGVDVFQSRTRYMPYLAHMTPAFPTVYDYFASYGINNRRGAVLDLSFSSFDMLSTSLSCSWYESQSDFAYDRLFAIAWQNPSRSIDLPWRSNHKILATTGLHFGAKRGPAVGSIYPLEETDIEFGFRHWSGRRYTVAAWSDEIFIGNRTYRPDGPFDGEITDNLWTVDLKFVRTMTIGPGLSFSAIVLIKNLTDNENVSAVWLTSGEPNTTGELGGDLYRLKENDPMNYAPPRQVFLGLGMRF